MKKDPVPIVGALGRAAALQEPGRFRDAGAAHCAGVRRKVPEWWCHPFPIPLLPPPLPRAQERPRAPTSRKGNEQSGFHTDAAHLAVTQGLRDDYVKLLRVRGGGGGELGFPRAVVVGWPSGSSAQSITGKPPENERLCCAASAEATVRKPGGCDLEEV